MAGPGDKDKKDGVDWLRDEIWGAYTDVYKDGYSKEDAARDTGVSKKDVDQAWSEAAKDSSN